MIEAQFFCSGREGPCLLALGGVHGDEPCGTTALDRLAADLSAGRIALERGRVVLVPRANPKAQATNTRFVDVNLNRVMHRHSRPELYEHFAANSLCYLIDMADAVLDLHAVSAKSPPFTFLDQETPAIRDWIAALGVPFALKGWNALYPATGDASSTLSYALSQGKAAIAVECGQKTDAASAERAYDFILRSLAHHGLAGKSDVYGRALPTLLRMTQVIWKEKQGYLTGPVDNFSPIDADQVLAVCADGEKLRAYENGYIVMPKEPAVVGEEWYYLAVDDGIVSQAPVNWLGR